MSKYLLKYHDLFAERILQLSFIVRELSKKLPKEEYQQHPKVKIFARLVKATLEIVPQDPNHRDYLLKGNLAKFRRYKKGLQRFRLIFCFSQTPPLIAYLYINDESHLRKDGSKNDPYCEFEALLKKGYFSHDPKDPKIQKWLTDVFKQA